IPIRLRFGNFFERAGDEIPPHHDRFRKCVAADKENAAASTTAEADFRAVWAEIVENARFKTLSIHSAIAAQKKRGVFISSVQFALHNLAGMDLHLSADDLG